MFNSSIAKHIGDAVRWNADVIRVAVTEAFQNAVTNEQREVNFFRKLLVEIKNNLNNLQLSGLNLSCRIAKTHQKPRVRVQSPRTFQCELADLLVVVKYVVASGLIERKSVLYQVKLCDSGTFRCKIDANQLELLSDWPVFEFGLLSNGGPCRYTAEPKTLEFGSFMLMERAPAKGRFVPCRTHFCNINAYGISPHALAVRRRGSTTVDISHFPYATNAADVFFSHIAFEIGEHHDFNAPVDSLVSALYRHLKLAPDPPDEFEGYTRTVTEEETGFGIIEITIKRGEGFDKDYMRGSTHLPPEKKQKSRDDRPPDSKRTMRSGS
ncbi:MAG: hypothetical protein QOH39_3388 [Verrucomicrobiota bacterium]|jgi:hypothetical protein